MYCKMHSVRSGLVWCRFAPIENRPTIRRILAEKYTKLFMDYENELLKAMEAYEANKVSRHVHIRFSLINTQFASVYCIRVIIRMNSEIRYVYCTAL